VGPLVFVGISFLNSVNFTSHLPAPQASSNEMTTSSALSSRERHAACTGAGSRNRPLQREVFPTFKVPFKEKVMLRLAIVFLLIAILAGVFGFTGVEVVSIELARIVFFIFLVLFVIALLAGAARGRPSDIV
jgi:uncharacterized membrane protein YtjA (UPF0391 family)